MRVEDCCTVYEGLNRSKLMNVVLSIDWKLSEHKGKDDLVRRRDILDSPTKHR